MWAGVPFWCSGASLAALAWPLNSRRVSRCCDGERQKGLLGTYWLWPQRIKGGWGQKGWSFMWTWQSHRLPVTVRHLKLHSRHGLRSIVNLGKKQNRKEGMQGMGGTLSLSLQSEWLVIYINLQQHLHDLLYRCSKCNSLASCWVWLSAINQQFWVIQSIRSTCSHSVFSYLCRKECFFKLEFYMTNIWKINLILYQICLKTETESNTCGHNGSISNGIKQTDADTHTMTTNSSFSFNS